MRGTVANIPTPEKSTTYIQINVDPILYGPLGIRGMAQKATNIAVNWDSEQELQLSSKKTKIVLFTHKRNPDLGSLSMNGSKPELSKEARLLAMFGVTLDSKLTRKLHITRFTRKATTALMQCRQIVGKTCRQLQASCRTPNHHVGNCKLYHNSCVQCSL